MPLDVKTKNKQNEEEYSEYEESSYYEHSEYYGGDEIFLKWRAPEHEPYTVGKRFLVFSMIFLSAVVIYALLTNSPIMAITFILIGIVGYIFLQKEPKMIDFAISSRGIIAGNQIYEFESLKSFWIFYDPPYEKILSLQSKNAFTPYIHIPIADENPVKIREIIIDFIPEEKQHHTIVDAAEKFLHR